jgi:hydroxymethylglutaryl-CoA lyase
MRPLFFHEVGPRDGLQNEPVFVPTDRKRALVESLAECGFARIEVTSFVSPTAIPALRDADELMRSVRRVPGVAYCALVPNRRGAERALAAGADEISLVMSASESHNQANLRRNREESRRELLALVRALPGGVPVTLAISTAFGCPFEGEVPVSQVTEVVEAFMDAGIRRFTLCDTTGMANPGQVRELVEALHRRSTTMEWCLHFHDTRGLALANMLAAVESGIDRFEGCVGGLGGCPYAPGASGNVATEDALHMFEALGYHTGVDLERVLAVARGLVDIVGHPGHGRMGKAGSRTVGGRPPVVSRTAGPASQEQLLR